MAFPSPSVSVPTLANFNVSFNGFTMGPGSGSENNGVGFLKIEGVDRPTVRSGDVDQPRTSGQFIGLDLLAGRDIILTAQLGRDAVSLAHAAQQLRNALSPRGTTEDPLFLNINGTTYACTVRARKDTIPIDIPYALGSLAQSVSILFHATDPHFYSTPTLAPTIGLPAPSGGFIFPITFPLSFGGGSGNNSVNVTNYGNVECWPILTITGPCLYPAISNLTTGQVLSFNLSMATGDTLVINTGNPHTATYTSAGSTIGSSRLYTLGSSSSWWNIPPGVGPNAVNGGVSTISFNSQDVVQAAGTCQIAYASAYSSLT